MFQILEFVFVAWLLALHSSSNKIHKLGISVSGGSLLQVQELPGSLRSTSPALSSSLGGGDVFAAVHDDLWEGVDILERHIASLIEGLIGEAKETSSQLPSLPLAHPFPYLLPIPHGNPKYVQDPIKSSPPYVILGAFDTGTSLFEASIRLNFPQLRRFDLWKHTLTGVGSISDCVEEFLPIAWKRSDIVVVAMVRSPISNIVSWKKAPYDLKSCLDRAWADMNQPCDGLVASIEDPESNPAFSMRFGSTMDAYNKYFQQYLDLKAAQMFKDVLLISYEDLVLDPLKVMQQFAQAYGTAVPSRVMVLSSPSKDHGDPVGRDAAINKIQRRTYLHAFTGPQSSELQLLCDGIDASLIDTRVAGSFRPPSEQVSYMNDCQ